MNISQGVVLNLSAGGIPPRLRMVQGDSNTRTIEASLWDGAQPYAVPDGSSVMVRFRKPDGTGGLYDTTEGGSPITFDGNNVAAPVATQMLAVPGEVAAEIDIYGTGTGAAAEKLATFRFVVEVAPCVLPDAEIISSDYYNILAAQIAAAVAAGEKADAALAAANQATAAAESAEQSKTAAAGSASSASRDAQTAASAKTDAVAAEAAAESAQEAAQASQTAAAGSASSAAEDAQSAAQAAEDAEAWAVGKRNGVDVPPSDPAYLNNAKYYKDQAQGIAGGEYVSYGTPQQLADAQKQQARENIGAAAPYTPGQNIAITGNTIGTKAFPCNPNLLDNWYFGNPVNQRGQTSYANNNSYTIDRWGIRGSEVTISIEDGGIVIGTDGAPFNSFIQSVENGTKNLAGQTVTFSALITENTQTADISYLLIGNADNPIAAGIEISGRGTFGGTGLKSITTTLPTSFSYSKLNCVICAGNPSEANKRFKILAAKLELGTEQTLAHQDANGNWVLNEIPDYGEQLRRCQRYCRPASLNFVISKSSDNGQWYASTIMSSPDPMRVAPVVINGNYSGQKLRVVTGGEIASVTGAFTPSIYGGFTLQLSSLVADMPTYGYIDGTGFTPLLSADL